MRIKTKTVLAVTSVAGIALLATAVTLAANGASKSAVTVSTRSVSGLGTILVNSRGRTLYMFAPDKRTKVTCFKNCAKIWPPLKLPVGAKIVAAGSAKKALLGSDKDSAGGRVVTYNHWPLYTYLGDSKAGVATGQALNLNGGLWYVLAPSGAVIKAKPGGGGGGGGGGTTTTTGGGGGGGTNCSDDDGDGDGTAGGPDDGDGCI